MIVTSEISTDCVILGFFFKNKILSLRSLVLSPSLSSPTLTCFSRKSDKFYWLSWERTGETPTKLNNHCKIKLRHTRLSKRFWTRLLYKLKVVQKHMVWVV